MIILPGLDERKKVFKASNKKHQKLYDHYIEAFKHDPIFCLCLKKNVLSDEMKPITTLVFEPTQICLFGNYAQLALATILCLSVISAGEERQTNATNT